MESSWPSEKLQSVLRGESVYEGPQVRDIMEGLRGNQ